MLQDEFQILHRRRMPWLLDLLARVAQLHHDAVLPHVGRLALLHQAHLLHLLVRVALIRPLARAASTVRHHHTAKPLLLVVKAFGDAVIRGDFQVILVGYNAQMRDAPQRRPRFSFVWNVEIVFGMSKLHGIVTMHRMTASAKRIPIQPSLTSGQSPPPRHDRHPV